MKPKRGPRYWLDLFTGDTWQEFRAAGATVSGFRENRWKTLQKVEPGDLFLCYLTGISRWVGVLEVTSKPFMDTTPIWQKDVFPARVKVKPIAMLDPETGVPVRDLQASLSMFQNVDEHPNSWTGHFRGSPTEFKAPDGRVIVAAIEAAHANPHKRPFDVRKLGRRPAPVESPVGAVAIPEPEAAGDGLNKSTSGRAESAREDGSVHTEVQWLLLKLGSDLGLDVWVARNDRGRSFNSQKFGELRGIRAELPRQFDEATNRTIELIDVLWLSKNSYVAAFEIESTTAVYSGLLRMADLLSMQPNLNIPLYLVAPDERREKVFAEVNRPTFARMKPALSEVCRYISFSALREQISVIGPMARHLRPEFLEDIAQECELDE